MAGTRGDGFRDRVDAGRQLAQVLGEKLQGDGVDLADAIVLGLPRGGVPVAAEVARALRAPLDVVLVRKLGLPGRPEVAMGAIGEEGAEVRDERLIETMGVTREQLAEVRDHERDTLEARAARLRGGRERLDLGGKHAILVDDGIATGATAAAACKVARELGAARVTLSAPVVPEELARAPGAAAMFGPDVGVVAVHAPRNFWAVGQYYADFSQTTDAEVELLLQTSRE